MSSVIPDRLAEASISSLWLSDWVKPEGRARKQNRIRDQFKIRKHAETRQADSGMIMRRNSQAICDAYTWCSGEASTAGVKYLGRLTGNKHVGKSRVWSCIQPGGGDRVRGSKVGGP